MSSKRSSSSSSSSFFSLSCGCKDSKSVSVSVSVSTDTSVKSIPKHTNSTDTTISSSYYETETQASTTPPSFSGLLRQLSDLEKSVKSLTKPEPEPEPEVEPEPEPEPEPERRRHHTRSRSEGGGRVEESVAVVKESDDPLSDFRRSMLQMIVEKEIVGGEELRELLRKFLTLNSPRHHDVILRAFADIWNEVFAAYEDTPDLLRRSKSNYYRPPPPRRRWQS